MVVITISGDTPEEAAVALHAITEPQQIKKCANALVERISNEHKTVAQEEDMDSVRGQEVKVVLIEAMNRCLNDQETTATGKLKAITGAVELLLKYETELGAIS